MHRSVLLILLPAAMRLCSAQDLPADLSAAGRVLWVTSSTFGPPAALAKLTESAIMTAANSPREYGGTWNGFGRRIGSKYATGLVSNSIEAGAGFLWREDPRYRPLGSGSGGSRLSHALKMSVMTEPASGGGALRPAYATYLGVVSGNVISNRWRPPSESSASDTALRIGFAFARRAGSNVLQEFWPELSRKLRHHREDRF